MRPAHSSTNDSLPEREFPWRYAEHVSDRVSDVCEGPVLNSPQEARHARDGWPRTCAGYPTVPVRHRCRIEPARVAE